MTRKAQHALDSLGHTLAQRVQITESSRVMQRYSPEAVQREIDRDKRISPSEAKLIHALLRGRD